MATRIQRISPALSGAHAVFGVGLVASCLLFVSLPAPWTVPACLAMLLYLIVDWTIVPSRREGLNVALGLPFLAAIGVEVGWPWAVILGTFAPALRSWIRAWSMRGAVHLPTWSANLGLTAGSLTGAATLAHQLPAGMSGAAFASVAMAVSALWALAIQKQQVFRGLSGIGVRSLTVGTLSLVAVSGAASSHSGSPLVLIAVLVPLMLLHRMLVVGLSPRDEVMETMGALMLMLQRAHPYSHGHLERVAKMAEEVALKLGLGPKMARQVHDAAILHDIGKIAVNEAILDKPAKLTEEEFDHIKRHSAYGAEILSQSRRFAVVSGWVLCHHERMDGRGYPEGLDGSQIPIPSRIIAVVDAFDAMVGSGTKASRRTYREPMDVSAALAELDRCAGTQFDPQVVRAFKDVVLGGEIV